MFLYSLLWETSIDAIAKKWQNMFDVLLRKLNLKWQHIECHSVNLSISKLQALSRGMNLAPNPSTLPMLTLWLPLRLPITGSGATEKRLPKPVLGGWCEATSQDHFPGSKTLHAPSIGIGSEDHWKGGSLGKNGCFSYYAKFINTMNKTQWKSVI